MTRVNQFSFCKVESDLITGVTRVAFLDGLGGTFHPVINSYTKEEAHRLGYCGDVVNFHREHIIIHNYMCDLMGIPYSPAIVQAIEVDTPCYFCKMEDREEGAVESLQQLLNKPDIKDLHKSYSRVVNKTIESIKNELWEILRG